jgi:pSer/pThr/pTyr-binding forkhead associated (FHA) protein
VEVFDNGHLDITNHQSGLTIGSIEGSGNIFLGANRLTVGANNINTSFSGVISGSGLLAKVGSGVLTLQANDCIADTVGLVLVSGSTIKLDFTGPPDVIASLKVNGVPQPPGIYGSPISGAPNILLEFRGSGTVKVGPLATLGNISTRALVQTGDKVMIGGFIIQGTEPKRVIIRAIGPELTQYGVPNVLVNPTLELHDSTGALIASNDNWQHTIIGGIITADQVRDIMATRLAPRDPMESAIVADLPAGNYTAIVRGVNNTTGVALVEAYDLSPETESFLGNTSTRSFVETGDNVMIGGFIVQGAQTKRVIVRAIGPELTGYGVRNALANPRLELYDANGALIASNDNWRTTIIGGVITNDQVRDIQNSGYAPGDGRESAIIAELAPGNYTAIVRGVNNTTGVALVEVYDLDH